MPAPKTYPSPSFVEIRTANPPGLKLEFAYNFYVPDEKIDDSGLFQGMPESDRAFMLKNVGGHLAEGARAVVAKTLSSPTGDLQRFIPRYVKVSLKPLEFEEKYTIKKEGD